MRNSVEGLIGALPLSLMETHLGISYTDDGEKNLNGNRERYRLYLWDYFLMAALSVVQYVLIEEKHFQVE